MLFWREYMSELMRLGENEIDCMNHVMAPRYKKQTRRKH